MAQREFGFLALPTAVRRLNVYFSSISTLRYSIGQLYTVAAEATSLHGEIANFQLRDVKSTMAEAQGALDALVGLVGNDGDEDGH